MNDIRAELRSGTIEHTLKKERYKIVITKYSNELMIQAKSWEQGANEDGSNYGYTPAIENIIELDRIILHQEVPELNLTAVICAVNGILPDIDIMTNRKTLIDMGWTPPIGEGIPG